MAERPVTNKDSKGRSSRRKDARKQEAKFDVKGRLAVSLMKALSFLPFRQARGLGRFVGKLLWSFNASAAKVTKENIGYAFKELSAQEQTVLARESVIQSSQTFSEMGKVWLNDDQWLMNSVTETENKERLDELLAEDRGVILLAPHLGNWEVLGRYLGIVCPVITCMYQPVQLRAMDDMIKGARSKNMVMAPTDKRGVMQLMKALKNNEIIGVLPDQLPLDGGGDFADFFGKPALTMTLIRQLQQKTNSAVIMAFAKRIDSGFRVIFMEPDPLIYSENPDEALLGLNRSVELCVHRAPEQYQWEYKRYRRQPEGIPRPYQFK